jgi:4-hydroxybenzoate polyprenyltransferase
LKIKKLLRQFKAFVLLTRVQNLAIIGLTQYLVAIFLSHDKSQWIEVILDWRLFLVVGSTLMIAAAGYMINDYYDVKIDLINKPKKVVIGRILKRRPVLMMHTVLNLTGVFLGLVAYWPIGVVNFFCAFLLWVYSNQLKRWPLIGNICIAFLTGCSVLVIGVLYQEAFHLVVAYAVFAACVNLIREIIKDMEDLKGDASFGCKTLPIILGIPKTKIFIYILTAGFGVLFIIIAHKLQNFVLNNFFIVLTLPSIFLLYRLYKADRPAHFQALSQLCKLIMIGGIFSMALF